MKITYSGILFLLITILYSQTNAQIAMGKWRTHLAYNDVTQIAQSENKIFAVSEGALFSVDKEDLGMEFYSKLSGLSDANISRIEYDIINKQLLITYNNGNIDIMTSGGIINVPDLYMKQMSASKNVNQIRFQGDRAYLACDFGIMVVNMTKREIADTYFIGPNGAELKIISTTILQNDIYAISNNNLFKAELNNPALSNYQHWQTIDNLPGTGDLKALVNFAGKIIIQRDNKLYYLENNTWTALFHDLSIGTLNISDNKMFIVHDYNQLYIADEQFNKKMVEGIGFVHDTEFDEERDITWLAAGSFGLLTFDENATDKINAYQPKGPALNIPFDMTFAGKKLFVTAGGRWASQDNREGTLMIFEDKVWTNILGRHIETITGQKVKDFMNVAVNPADNSHFFVTSYGTGLYEFKNNEFHKWHNNDNSVLETIIPSNPYAYIRLDGGTFDRNGNLYILNSSVSSAIKILTNEGEWKKLTFQDAVKPTLGDLLISKTNEDQKWITSVRNKPGLFIFDDNGTLYDSSDDRTRFFSNFSNSDEEGSTITPANFICLTQDKNGVIWVGTDQGPLLFYNTERVFDEGYTCTRVKIPRNDGTDRADYLLQEEKIKAIAIDGANRKWLGTETSGIFLMSENGQETIHHFTTQNSPLLSNDILSISIHPTSGEVYIGTGKGLVSYQSDAVDAENVFTNVHAYPNPVRENYNGIITITGLVADTQVKITDLNGNLVCETISNGGIATWDGKNTRGQKVSTGIYLVICANGDGTQSTATKILFIN
ncbi:MAG: T9SS type A sorting domain-containing protein [Paludibacteraceae bacterium]|nr:T9SS type A sorting domain-containing protein [Paludibacteraceae bacterium]